MESIEKISEREPDKIVCKPPNIWADDRIFFAWQRSHMANERTFLAWCRTSISLLAFGFVMQRVRAVHASAGSIRWQPDQHSHTNRG